LTEMFFDVFARRGWVNHANIWFNRF